MRRISVLGLPAIGAPLVASLGLTAWDDGSQPSQVDAGMIIEE